MRAAITGATGLVGSNLALQLLEQGIAVRCTYRAKGVRKPSGSLATSDVQSEAPTHLKGFPIEWVRAELDDPDSLKAAFLGCDVVFHCAAQISLLRRPTPPIIKANVDGTRNVISAVRAAGVERLVHCSSTVTCAISTDGIPVDETKPWNFADFGVDEAYSITKRQAEELVVAEAARGLSAVIVNPGYMFGPYDFKPSSGKMIIQVVQGKVPGTTSGNNNFVDVRDVCRGMIAAWQRGRRGERYILGNQNLSYGDVFRLIAQVAGVKPPRLAMPKALATPVGWLGDLAQAITGREALINSVSVRYGYLPGHIFSSEKAKRELGYAPGPLETAIRDAIAWFRRQHML